MNGEATIKQKKKKQVKKSNVKEKNRKESILQDRKTKPKTHNGKIN